MLRGSCLCGSVKFAVEPEDRVLACHCTQCRKNTGHHWASGQADATTFDITGKVKWYRATDRAERGFCPTCGSFLFWQGDGEQNMSFSLGAIDGPTGLKLQQHIFTADKGDYYDIADNVPQRED